MDGQLKREFEWYLAHQGEMVEKYDGKFIVLKDQRVLGAYDTQEQALTETLKTLELGTFLVQKVEPGDDSFTRTFHSRVAATIA